MYNHSCPFCGGSSVESFSISEAELNDLVDKLTKSLHEGGNQQFDKKMIQFTADKLLMGMMTGYGKDFTNVDFNSPDWKMLEHIENNVYQFSAAKNFQQLKQMTSLLMDNGKLRTFSEYKKQVQNLNVKFNKTWLKTEYDLAIAGGQMASKWVEFSPDAMLKYSTAGDARVRDSHAELDGIKRPRNDDFWATHYPPNGFNCRCNVISTASKEATDTNKIPSITIMPMFKTNLAANGLVFPKDHPYFIGNPSTEINKVATEILSENKSDRFDLSSYFNSKGKINSSGISDLILKLTSTYGDGKTITKVKFVNADYFMANSRVISDKTGKRVGKSNSLHISNKEIKGWSAGKSLVEAFELIHAGKGNSLNFHQEYAIESLWHEINHSKAVGWKSVKFKTIGRTGIMETINQYYSRQTYHTFLEQLGGKATNQNQVKESGMGYTARLNNFNALVKHHNINSDELTQKLKPILFDDHYENIGRNTESILKDMGVKNADDLIKIMGENSNEFNKHLL